MNNIKKMVNEIVLDYLRKYHDKYPLEALKKKILDSGYEKKEIDDALIELGVAAENEGLKLSVEENPEKTSITETEFKEEAEGKTFRWIGMGGIAGIILILIGLISLILIISDARFDISEISNLILLIFFSVVGFIMFLLFYFAFFKLGEKTNLKLLKLSSIIIIAGSLILGALAVFFSILTQYQISSMIEGVFVNKIFFPITGFAISDQLLIPTDELRLDTFGIILYSIFFLAFIFILIANILFGKGLTKAKEHEKLAKIAGIFHLITSIIISLFVFTLIAVFLIKPQLFSDEISLIKTISIFLGFLGLATTLLESIVLLKTSKKFE